MQRHELLATLHELMRPRTYLEVGVNTGLSMQLSSVPSVGVDPAFTVTAEVQCDVQLARTSSDEFFTRRRPLAHLPIPTVDLAFVDGMHLAEFALRDVVAVERFMDVTGVIVIDDTLPTTVAMANRWRATTAWTGDVYKAVQALRRLRPDLVVIDVGTAPTGTTIVLLPDASRDGVLDGYDDWMITDAITPDPQPVPTEVLERTRALPPEVVLDSPGWLQLRGMRSGSPSRESVREAFADLVDAAAAISPS